MSPKSERLTVAADTVSKMTSKQSEEVKEIKRDHIFARMDKPLGLEQETFNLLWIGTAHFFTAYACYMQLTRQMPYSTLLFGEL